MRARFLQSGMKSNVPVTSCAHRALRMRNQTRQFTDRPDRAATFVAARYRASVGSDVVDARGKVDGRNRDAVVIVEFEQQAIDRTQLALGQVGAVEQLMQTFAPVSGGKNRATQIAEQ